MYNRVTTFSFDPDREDDMLAVANSSTDEMKAIAGLQSATIIRVGGGKTITIGAYDSEESAKVAQPKIQSILGG